MGRRQREKVPRSKRFCKACGLEGVCACVEDDKHFLLECHVYESIRMKYRNMFNEDSTPTNVLSFPDQKIFGHVLHELISRCCIAAHSFDL